MRNKLEMRGRGAVSGKRDVIDFNQCILVVH